MVGWHRRNDGQILAQRVQGWEGITVLLAAIVVGSRSRRGRGSSNTIFFIMSPIALQQIDLELAHTS